MSRASSPSAWALRRATRPETARASPGKPRQGWHGIAPPPAWMTQRRSGQESQCGKDGTRCRAMTSRGRLTHSPTAAPRRVRSRTRFIPDFAARGRPCGRPVCRGHGGELLAARPACPSGRLASTALPRATSTRRVEGAYRSQGSGNGGRHSTADGSLAMLSRGVVRRGHASQPSRGEAGQRGAPRASVSNSTARMQGEQTEATDTTTGGVSLFLGSGGGYGRSLCDDVPGDPTTQPRYTKDTTSYTLLKLKSI